MPIDELAPTSLIEMSKSQNIRLLDILLIGPMMIYGGYNSKMNDFGKIVLISFGIATIAYNGKNYIINKTAASRSS